MKLQVILNTIDTVCFRPKRVLASVLFVIIATYSILAIGDFLISLELAKSKFKNSEATRVEQHRADTIDVPLRRKALAEGYRPIIYPDFIESQDDFSRLAEKYKVAPLAPQPRTNLYFCNEGFGLIKYQSDRYGFRNDDSLWDVPVDIVLIGDSFVHGACVEEEHTIAGRLRGSGLSVLNLGSGSNNPGTYAALSKVFLPIASPRFAVMVFYANDNDYRAKHEHLLNHYFDVTSEGASGSSRDYRSHNEALDAYFAEAETLAMGLVSRPATVQAVRDEGDVNFISRVKPHLKLATLRALTSTLTLFNSRLDKLSTGALDTLVKYCKPPKCSPMVVYIPPSNIWRPDSRAPSFERQLTVYSKGLGVQFWSASEMLDVLTERAAYAPMGPHLSPLGYKVVADGIASLIAARMQNE